VQRVFEEHPPRPVTQRLVRKLFDDRTGAHRDLDAEKHVV